MDNMEADCRVRCKGMADSHASVTGHVEEFPVGETVVDVELQAVGTMMGMLLSVLRVLLGALWVQQGMKRLKRMVVQALKLRLVEGQMLVVVELKLVHQRLGVAGLE